MASETTTGRCRCGQLSFRIAGAPPAELTRCTCSYCAKRGVLIAYYAPEQFAPSAEPGADGVYRWNTKLVAHHFCAACGVPAWSDSPAFGTDGSWDGRTRRIGVNARLFDDYDAAAQPVTVIDGRHLW